jgi:hypothetical protein
MQGVGGTLIHTPHGVLAGASFRVEKIGPARHEVPVTYDVGVGFRYKRRLCRVKVQKDDSKQRDRTEDTEFECQ